MPLKRTPPSTPTNLETSNSQSLCRSDPNLSLSQEKCPASQRIKRKRELDIDQSEYDDFKTKVLDLFQDLKSSIDEIKEQNLKLQQSVDFTAAKYDEIMTKMKQIQDDKLEDRKYIASLEDKIEQLERQSRNTSLEIRNIPKKMPESKQDLVSLVSNIGQVLKSPILPSEIKDIFRTNTKLPNKPIVVEFTTVLAKEKILQATKLFNKENRNNKLNTRHLNLDGQNQPIYLSDNLTTKTKRIFFLAREFAKQNNFKYCWTSYGKVLLRKDEGCQFVRIDSESDLCKLSNQK